VATIPGATGSHLQVIGASKSGRRLYQLVTFPYAERTQANLGVPYSEKRIYQDIELGELNGRLHLAFRFRLVQRWVGVLATDNPRLVADWAFKRRIRYQVSGKLPFLGEMIENGKFYLCFFDELIVGFGKQLNENICNQNQISAGRGY